MRVQQFITAARILGVHWLKRMAKISASSSSSSPTVSKDLPPHYADAAVGFLIDMGISDEYHVKDLYSDLFRSLLKTDHVGRGHVSCVFSVLPAVAVTSHPSS